MYFTNITNSVLFFDERPSMSDTTPSEDSYSPTMLYTKEVVFRIPFLGYMAFYEEEKSRCSIDDSRSAVIIWKFGVDEGYVTEGLRRCLN